MPRVGGPESTTIRPDRLWCARPSLIEIVSTSLLSIKRLKPPSGKRSTRCAPGNAAVCGDERRGRCGWCDASTAATPTDEYTN